MNAIASQHLSRFWDLSEQLIAEVDARDGAQPVRSSAWPTVADVAAHVASVYQWASTVMISTNEPVKRQEDPLADPVHGLRQAREALWPALQADAHCWILGGSTGTTSFWRRRMALETAKHLLDVRTRPEERFAIPTQLDPELAADGIDEFFSVFLARSRATLAPLPGSIRLNAADAGRSWRLSPTWDIDEGSEADAAVDGDAAALLLMLWERADAFGEPDRFTITGDVTVARALVSAPIHL
jgi:hypothetical protein